MTEQELAELEARLEMFHPEGEIKAGFGIYVNDLTALSAALRASWAKEEAVEQAREDERLEYEKWIGPEHTISSTLEALRIMVADCMRFAGLATNAGELMDEVDSLRADLAKAQARIAELEAGLTGLMREFDKMIRYGSPMAKTANENYQYAARLLHPTEQP